MVPNDSSYAAATSTVGLQALQLQDLVCGDTHTLVMSGELDMAGCSALSAVLAHLCRDGIEALVLDLRRLSFVDSSGIHAILRARELCSEHGCELRVIPGQAQVQRAFAICGLLDQLPFRDDGGERPEVSAAPAADLLAASISPHRREPISGGDS
jgi:anti-sigma B factor antagonist